MTETAAKDWASVFSSLPFPHPSDLYLIAADYAVDHPEEGLDEKELRERGLFWAWVEEQGFSPQARSFARMDEYDRWAWNSARFHGHSVIDNYLPDDVFAALPMDIDGDVGDEPHEDFDRGERFPQRVLWWPSPTEAWEALFVAFQRVVLPSLSPKIKEGECA